MSRGELYAIVVRGSPGDRQLCVRDPPRIGLEWVMGDETC